MPRAKVYEVLASLEGKDLVSTSQNDGRTLYHPLPYQTLFSRHLRRAQEVVGVLEPELEALTQREEAPPLITIRSRERVLDRARDVINAARQRLFVSAWPPELQVLAGDLHSAEARGVDAYVLVYGEASLPLVHLFRHTPIKLEHRAAGAPWLIVVADHAESLVAEPAPGEQAVALWTRNRVIATVAAEYVKHDIFLMEMAARLEARGITLDREMADLQRMWFEGG